MGEKPIKKIMKKTSNTKKPIMKINVNAQNKVKKSSKKMIKKTSQKISKPSPTMIKKPEVTNEVEIEPADPPYSVQTGGWRQKIEENSEAPKKPLILKTKAETWGKRAVEIQNNPTLKKGLFILVFANEKAGKTRFGLTSSRFNGYNGSKRIIPVGYPTYVLDSENAVLAEAIINFEDEVKEGNIIVQNYSVKNPETKKRNAKETIETLEEWSFSLSEEENGTLIIDTFTEYCDCVNDRLVNVVGKGYNDEGVEIKKLAPVQYSWRTKQVVEFLHALRDFPMNVILICQAKDEYVNPDPKNPFESYKTGQLLADALKKVYYWVDVICVMDKTEDEDGFIERTLHVKDSRFEDEKTIKDDLVLLNENITLENLVNLFKEKL